MKLTKIIASTVFYGIATCTSISNTNNTDEQHYSPAFEEIINKPRPGYHMTSKEVLDLEKKVNKIGELIYKKEIDGAIGVIQKEYDFYVPRMIKAAKEERQREQRKETRFRNPTTSTEMLRAYYGICKTLSIYEKSFENSTYANAPRVQSLGESLRESEKEIRESLIEHAIYDERTKIEAIYAKPDPKILKGTKEERLRRNRETGIRVNKRSAISRWNSTKLNPELKKHIVDSITRLYDANKP